MKLTWATSIPKCWRAYSEPGELSRAHPTRELHLFAIACAFLTCATLCDCAKGALWTAAAVAVAVVRPVVVESVEAKPTRSLGCMVAA